MPVVRHDIIGFRGRRQFQRWLGNGSGAHQIPLRHARCGMAWTSVRGPVSIDAATRDIVQPVSIRKAEVSGAAYYNVEFDQVEKVRDTGV
ncbi:hypothetical protein [Janthinobacterium sp. HLX7-2]|uniref:hypothetical protein n=1 Tax=Janthinobacterium sp. HLX7-2 TaxID=1259331 RepID=UPI003F1EA44F